VVYGRTVRAGFCAIVGLPNVGKSTLLNRMLGVRLVAVSPKPQTTRHRILGVHAIDVDDDRTQIAYVDTPGVQLGKGPLRRFMRDQAITAAGDCDVALLVLDASDRTSRTPERLAKPDAEALAARVTGRPVVVALNKVDRVAKPELLPLIAAWSSWRADTDVIPIVATTGEGVADVERAIARRLPEGPALYPDDVVTDRADRFLAGELIREQLYHQLGKELPYACAVQVETWDEKVDRTHVSIGAVIVVERESQKAIVVGKGGQRIKQIGIAAREALAELLEMKVHLSLFVKVVPEWSQGEARLRELGYDEGPAS
jgi:GTP-binding protein Era